MELLGTTAKRRNLLTNRTLLKAKTIYNAGGVEHVYPHRYLVHSTSGETYTVNTRTDTCECTATVTCSHMAAVEFYRSARRKRAA